MPGALPAAVRGTESTTRPDEAIDRILELSSDAHTKRREAAENSSAFHKLTGAVLAYGQALDLFQLTPLSPPKQTT